ncbi:TMEM165/GDT1 family protein [Pelistega europaea]|uniref:GDT1 family protein n=1 Tax=Pelistega europaea TaxID=106147 RepID=A0A7Y4P5A1_9BURK|nr:TMEM165/GDT1 family protein [Pelistega europaea]NOL49573.1 TMEM165/GDT1 family protein [Pelistega europaea]
MNALLVSTGVVALAEMGDKTQLLAFLLAARFQKPLPIVLGITLATIVNHALAGLVGVWITHILSPDMLRWILGGSFIAMAIWMLIPDKLEEDEVSFSSRLGIFGLTCVTFFLAEMGDKTQIATVAMAARFDTPVLVVIGTTLGMLIANVPAVFLGEKFAQRFSPKVIHSISAGIFAVMGLLTLFKADEFFSSLMQ